MFIHTRKNYVNKILNVLKNKVLSCHFLTPTLRYVDDWHGLNLIDKCAVTARERESLKLASKIDIYKF
jgi:hypothetical protein